MIKVVTSGNAGHGLDRFPGCAVSFHMLGPWCSGGAPLSMACRSTVDLGREAVRLPRLVCPWPVSPWGFWRPAGSGSTDGVLVATEIEMLRSGTRCGVVP